MRDIPICSVCGSRDIAISCIVSETRIDYCLKHIDRVNKIVNLIREDKYENIL